MSEKNVRKIIYFICLDTLKLNDLYFLNCLPTNSGILTFNSWATRLATPKHEIRLGWLTTIFLSFPK